MRVREIKKRRNGKMLEQRNEVLGILGIIIRDKRPTGCLSCNNKMAKRQRNGCYRRKKD